MTDHVTQARAALEQITDLTKRQQLPLTAQVHGIATDALARLSAELAARSGGWQDIVTAPKDGTEFLSYGGPDNVRGKVQPTRWLSPGPYTTENGKNAEGKRRYQWPDGFYWAGYDGFVGPVMPTHWRPFPTPPAISSMEAPSQ